MERKDYETTTNLIDEAYKNVRMGSFAIDCIIDKIEDPSLEDLLRKQIIVELKNLIEKAMENRDFGNARFVENLKEAILREKAKIVEKCYNFESLEELEKMLYSITADDIPQYLVENTKSKEKVLGFQPKK